MPQAIDTEMQQERIIKSGMLYREARVENPNAESRTADLVFSTEDSEVERWFGKEILGHTPDEVDLTRLDTGAAPLLMDHDWRDQVGVIEKAEISKDRKGRAVVRFGKSARAEEIFQDIQDKIRQCVSVGYFVNELVLTKAGKEGEPSKYRVTDWQPFEISIVSVPADIKAGIGRSESGEQREIRVLEPKTNEEPKMPDPVIQENRQPALPAAAPAAASVDVEKAVREGVEKERKRVADINALAAAHSRTLPEMDAMRLKFISEDRSPDDFRVAVLDELAKRTPEKIRAADNNPNIGMDSREVEGYSLLRMIRSIEEKDKSLAPLEWEASNAVRQKFSERSFRGHFQIPNEVLLSMGKRAAMKRALNTGVTGGGAELVGTLHDSANFIELLRNRIVVAGLGARILSGLVGNVAIPKQTGGATAYWVAEDQDVTESSLATGSVVLSPKTIGGHTKVTRQQLLQSSPDVQMLVEDDLLQILAQGIDVAALSGTGADGQPTGLTNVSGVGSTTITGAIDFGDTIDMISDVEVANALQGSLAYVTTPTLKGVLMQTLKSSVAGATYVWAENNTINGYPALASNNVPSGKAIFGNWNDLIIGEWGVLDMIVDTNTYSSAGAVKLVALQSIDVAIRHAAAFSVAA